MIAWIGLAMAGPGERLEWAVSYLGAEVGSLRSEVSAAEGGAWRIEARAESAEWFRSVYWLEDHFTSVWHPERGSLAYAAKVREGDYRAHLEVLPGSPTRVLRNGVEAWVEGVGAAEDPLSAIWRARAMDLENPQPIPVFDGRRFSRIPVVARREAEGWRVRLDLPGDGAMELELRGEERVPVTIKLDNGLVKVSASLR